MNHLPIRVKLDFTHLNLTEYSHVWFPVKMCSFSKICDVKANICEKYNLPFDEIELFIKGALLREDETILLLRDNDSIQVVRKEYEPCSANSITGQGDEKRAKRKRQSHSQNPWNDCAEKNVMAVQDMLQNSPEDAQNHESYPEIKLRKRYRKAESRLSDLCGSAVTVNDNQLDDSLPVDQEHSEFVSESVLSSGKHHKKKKHKNKKQDDGTSGGITSDNQQSSNSCTSVVISNAETGEPCYSAQQTEAVAQSEEVLSAVDRNIIATLSANPGEENKPKNVSCLQPLPSKLSCSDNLECKVNNSGDSVNLDTTNCPKKKRRRRRKRRSSKIQPEVIDDSLVSKNDDIKLPQVGSMMSSSNAESSNKHIRFKEQTPQSSNESSSEGEEEPLILFKSPKTTQSSKSNNNNSLSSEDVKRIPEEPVAAVDASTAPKVSPARKVGISGNTQDQTTRITPSVFSRRHNFGKPYLSQTLEHLRRTASAMKNGDADDTGLYSSPSTAQCQEVDGSGSQGEANDGQILSKLVGSLSPAVNGVKSAEATIELEIAGPSKQHKLQKTASENGVDSVTDKFPVTQNSSCKELTHIEKSCRQHKDYNLYPPLRAVPAVGTRIAFKLLELSELYCPEVSDYKEGCIVGIESGDTVRIELAKEELKKPKSGKFENVYESDPEDEEVQIVKTVTPRWTELIEPKLIAPLIGQ